MKISKEFHKTRDTQQKWSEMKITDKRRKGFKRESKGYTSWEFNVITEFWKKLQRKSKEELLKRAKRNPWAPPHGQRGWPPQNF